MPRFAPFLEARLAAAVGLGLALSACASDRSVTGSTYPMDVRERHPIMLGQGSRKLDVFVHGSGSLDPRQRDDVHAFATEYRRYGFGTMAVQVPSGGPGDAAARGTLASVREALAEAGLPEGAFTVASYPVADPSIAAPIRLSFGRTQARVATRCGLWPQDIGVSDPGFSARNEPYWNLGCATQANVAAQIADPVDLVRARSEGRIDTLKRQKTIENLRNGKDPSTQYRQDGQNSVKQQVAN